MARGGATRGRGGALVQADAEEVVRLAGVRRSVAKRVPLDGSKPMTGALVLGASPTLDAHATTKAYTDARDDVLLPLNGAKAMTGALTLGASPTLSGHATTKAYADARDDTRLPLDGSKAMTGALVLGASPTLDTHATTKAYTDARDDLLLALNGTRAMTGALTLGAQPSLDAHAATKLYVDNKAGERLLRGGDSVSGLLNCLQGVATKPVLGAPSDASFPEVAIGLMAVDVTNSRLYVRVGTNVWRSVLLA